MTDCFSLPNMTELAEQLRQEARTEVYDTAMMLLTAADAIEAVIQENKKLKAERNAAVADLKYYGYCKNCSQCTTKYGFYLCKIHGTVYWNDTCDDWEWCGAQNEEE